MCFFVRDESAERLAGGTRWRFESLDFIRQQQDIIIQSRVTTPLPRIAKKGVETLLKRHRSALTKCGHEPVLTEEIRARVLGFCSRRRLQENRSSCTTLFIIISVQSTKTEFNFKTQ